MNCGGLVLCGGQSRRMGLDKASLPFGSETMLARVVRLECFDGNRQQRQGTL